MVEVRLFAYLRDGRGKVLQMDASDLTDGRALLAQLNIPEDRVAIYLINGFHKPLTEPIHDEDTISLFPPVAGG